MEFCPQEDIQNPNISSCHSPSQSRDLSAGSVDATVSGWILEFLLRKQVEDRLVKDFFPVLSFPESNVRLKKTVLLRTIQSEISNGRVSEIILNHLEDIHQLDRSGEVVVLQSMKKAYCAVAVNCTIKFLDGKVDYRKDYFDAVVRIWKERVGRLEKSEEISLFSVDLWNWKTDIEAAVWNTNACKLILKRNMENDAIDAVKTYLMEAWKNMGPSFLELVATQVMRKGSTRGEISDIMDVLSCDQFIDSPFVRHVNTATDIDPSNCSKDPRSKLTDKEIQKIFFKRKHVEFLGRCNGKDLHSKSNGDKILDGEGSNKQALHERYSGVKSVDVRNTRAALRSSSLGLHDVVKDPLPDAMRVAETLMGKIGGSVLDVSGHMINGNNHREASPVNESDSFEASKANEDRKGRSNQYFSPANIIAELVNSNEDDSRNQCFGPQDVVLGTKSSLIEQNMEEHSAQCDDRLANVSPIRYCLPSPSSVDVSPLKLSEIEKLSRRRRNKRWSSMEEDTLRTAVQKLGRGNWKLILNSYPDTFQERTEVDLKDKWRNMIK